MSWAWGALVVVYFATGAALLVQGALHWSLLRAARRTPDLPPEDAGPKGNVLVQLPLYNEERVVEALLEAVNGLRWGGGDLVCQILDDSTDATPQRVMRWLDGLPARPGVQWEYLRRTRRDGFKAGALAAGLQAVPEAEFVAIFDADFRPAPDFLERAVAALEVEPSLAAVQARWAHLNPGENALTRVQALNLDAHFTVEQGGRTALGDWASFNGTAGVWRRAAIEAAGGWRGDTLAEDFDLSVRAHLAGWGIRYLDGLEAPAELPAEFGGYAVQQHRWTAGGAGCARKHVWPVIRATRGSRRWHALGQLFASSIHVPVFLMTTASVPLVWAEHEQPQFHWVLPTGGVFALALATMVALYAYAHRKRAHATFFPGQILAMMLLGTGMTWRNVRAVAQGWTGRAGGFQRTPKAGTPLTAAVRKGGVEWALAVYFGAGLAAGALTGEWGLMPFHALLAGGYGWVATLAAKG